MTPKPIVILGSTGSVGRQALEVVERFEDRLRVVGLAAGDNVEALAEQATRWRPQIVSVRSREGAEALRGGLPDGDIRVVGGEEGLLEVALHPDAELVVNAVVGAAGLPATYEAVRAGKTVALANKESLVMAGELVMAAARRSGATVLPVDSEPNALHQCLRGTRAAHVRRLILTASGGPFLGWDRERLAEVTPEQALEHPTWEMGRRISVDSATLMNKGFEIIECRWLFDVQERAIEVVIHPQSVVHSMVELADGSLLAHAGPTDMRLPLQDVLAYPERWPPVAEPLELPRSSPWTFQAAAEETYPALGLARRALALGGTAPAVLNAADEVAVEAFLEGNLRFDRILTVVADALDRHDPLPGPSLEAIREADREGRELARDRVAHLAEQLVE